MSFITWRRHGALVPFLLLAAACGGGGGGGGGGTPATFTVTAINPAVSVDLFGGDTVTLTGTNFATAGVTTITFGGVAGTNRTILSETELTVVTPAAPGLQPGAVTVVVASSFGGTLPIPNGYTYANSPPNPQTIAPTTFSPTGAESFTITGTTLGPLGGQVTVVFQGIGSVTADVSPNGTQVTGRAPVAAGVPPIGAITVTIDTGSATVNVPTTVGYTYSPPFAVVGVPFQTAGNASQPVRLADGFAVLCAAGPTTWGNSDDEIKIVTGPPNGITIGSVSPRGAPGTQVGYLSATSSIPVVLGPDTFCVYSVGAAGPGVWLVTNARTAPVADFIPYPGINAAPIAAIGPARIAFTAAGPDLVFGPVTGAPLPANQGDDLVIMDFNLAVTPPIALLPVRVPGIVADISTTGPGNFTIPFSPDGDTVFVMDTGPDNVRWNADDAILAHTVSTATSSTPFNAPFLLGRPIAFSTSLLAAAGVGANGLAGGGDDTLEVFTYTGGAWARMPYLLGQTVNAATALNTYARVGNGIVVALTPNALRLYSNPAAGTATTLPFNGTPLLAPFGNGALMAFGPGPNLVPATGNDDQALHIDPLITSIDSFSLVPNLFQNIVPLSDGDRMFAVSPGPDGAFLTGDDTLEIYQSAALFQPGNVCQLPLAVLPVAPVSGQQPFVPIGPGWGLLQSWGISGFFGDINDQLILIQY